MSATQLYIHVPFNSQRLVYTLNWLINYRFGLHYKLVVNPSYKCVFLSGEPSDSPEPKVILDTNSSIFIEESLSVDYVATFKKQFQTRKSQTPNFLSAIFFCLSRYEEWVQPEKTDKHNRFLPQHSILYENDFVVAWVDEMVIQIKDLLSKHFPDLSIKEPSKKNELTFDLDVGLLYAGKGLFRSLGGAAKDVFQFKFKQLFRRLQCWVQPKKDPLFLLPGKYPVSLVFAPLWHSARFDRNLKANSKSYIKLLKQYLANGVAVGLHPSYNSSESKYLLPFETELFNRSNFGQLRYSRQHFLRFKHPNTFEKLAELGITKEYSMGYSNVPGFRAGTGFPFPYFNLAENKAANIEIVPFALMDNCFFNGSAQEIISNLKNSAVETKSPITIVWHDWTAANQGPGKDLKPILENLVIPTFIK